MSLLGIPIGFYGYLLPGNINLMVLLLYSERRFGFLLKMLVLILFFESLYCFTSLYLLICLSSKMQWINIIENLGFCLTFVLGIWMIIEENTTQKAKRHIIYRGVFSIIIHPQQIPFWLFVGVLLQGLSLASWDKDLLIQFVFFNAIGTLLVLALYAIYGDKLLAFFNLKISQVNKIVGVIYILISISFILKQI